MTKQPEKGKDSTNDEPKKCGIIMPISNIDGCSEKHWEEVEEILKDVIEEAGFTGDLVSYSSETNIIQKTIIQNLYDNPIVICDVSCKNPNVMFELGMRLAFSKPTVIIKDDKTNYIFDTSPIEHLEYPRDLHFPSIIKFKAELKEKITATFKSKKTFLQQLGTFKVAEIEKETIPSSRYILEKLGELQYSIEKLSYEDKKDKIFNNFTYKDLSVEQQEFVNKFASKIITNNTPSNSIIDEKSSLIDYEKASIHPGIAVFERTSNGRSLICLRPGYKSNDVWEEIKKPG